MTAEEKREYDYLVKLDNEQLDDIATKRCRECAMFNDCYKCPYKFINWEEHQCKFEMITFVQWERRK